MDEPESQLLGLQPSSTLQANAAIAAHYQGHHKQAYQLIESIQALDLPFGTMELPRDRVHKNSEQARAYLAIGDYEKAGFALEQSLGATGSFWRVMEAVASLGVTEYLVGVARRVSTIVCHPLTGIRCNNISLAWSVTQLRRAATSKVDSHQGGTGFAQYS